MSGEVGAVPEGWAESTVGQALAIRNNLRFPISTEERLKMVGEYPYYGPTGILSYINEHRLDGEFATIGEDGDHFLKYQERPMTLLISGKFNVNNHAHVLASTDRCEASWFANYYMHRELTPFLTRQGAGRYKLTKVALESLPILLPPLPEQQKIAAILSTWDDSLSTLARLLDAKRQQKRGLAEALLTGKKRLKGFEGEWELTQLGRHIFEVSARNKGSQIERVLSVTNHSGFVLPEEQFSKRVASENISNYKIVRRGQFAYNPSRLNVGSLARLDSFDEGVVSPLYVVFDVGNSLCREYLLYWLESPLTENKIKASVQGSVRDSVNFHALAGFSLALPPLPEQQAIASILSTPDGEIASLERLRGKVQEQKRGLMDELLTGRVRVKVV